MATTSKNITMDDLLGESTPAALTTGEVVEGKVLSVKKHEVWVDLGTHGIGLVPRREIGLARSLVADEPITASVVDPELEDGYALLSLRKAAKDRGWEELQRIFEAGETIEVTAYDANRGGLLIELEGIRGFMPVSQLSAEHYPRVAGADKDEILQRLNALINQSIKVRILDANRKENKLIFSEKEAIRENMQERFEKLKVGDEVEGTVTGVVDFGAFVNVDGIEGLVHISEISWERVNNPADYVKIGDTVKAKIIAIDKDRLSLSIKQLSADPWLKEVEKFKKGDVVEGSVTRITPFGAFIQISPAVEALVHVTELGEGDGADPEKIFKLNEKKEFVILDIDKENRKISLGLKK
ncbi:MAG TPA: S1 RNA-binding domain-containing protein [Candidatus Saccharimonadales bacterium]|nr:S1 RNA-binding domain-containing protein [Candidatus Saccharimonadales bacterium]